MSARASRRAREASRVATSMQPAVATTVAVLTPTSTPTPAPAGLLYICGAAAAVRWKHTDAYQQPPASLLTVTFSIRARPRTSRRRSLAWARHGAARATHPYLATRRRPGCSSSPAGGGEPWPVPVAGLEPGEPGLALQEAGVRRVRGADAVPERPDRLAAMPRRGHALGGVPAADQVEV